MWKRTALVPQNFACWWPLRARENITLGQPKTFDDGRVWDVVDAVGMREAVEKLPQRLDTLLAKEHALDHPALFRVMFAEPCDPTREERVAATAAISEYVRGIVRATFPEVDADALSTTVWALVHGLAFLHLDGKLDTSTPEVVATQVRSAVHALFAASPAVREMPST
ncbi:WHG domain-containing protein [Streptomyces sp. NPDC096191]|uniref:TetR-like C-terminal domain-containing protein n=1 Tax=Streptomyces sp. NPDC096191 TaxID=3155426 RepID=UPI00332CD86C